MKTHKINKGECLSSLAEKYRFHDPDILYSHGDNASLKAKRDNLNLLCENDKVKIPDKEKKEEAGSDAKRHKFKAKGIRTHIRLLVEDFDGNGLAGKKYKLEVGNEVFEGTTTGDGLVEQVVLAKETKGKLQIWLNDKKTASIFWPLEIGDLEPHKEQRGIQARLNNLGFSCGEVDGIIGPNTKAAVKAFKKKNGRSANDVLSPQTINKIKNVYGF